MEITLSAAERAALEAAASRERRVRIWRRCQAVLLLGAGQPPQVVATTLGCSLSSVYGWAATWRQDGVPALAGQPHGGGVVALDVRAGPLLERLLGEDPQARGHCAAGWTVPLLRTELAAAGYRMSTKTIRRALHRLGYRWKRPKYVLGRPDPTYTEKKTP